MNRDDELLLRRWLAARDPGPARAELHAAARAVAATQRASRFPGLDLTLRAGFGLAPIARPLLVGLVVLLALAALAGSLVLQPWRPFPPRGLLAYTAPLAATGSYGISLVAADGSASRQVSSNDPNVYDHSPRWSRDGRTLLVARTSQLDSLSACGGVGSVVLYDVASGEERVVATGLRPMNVIDWSPSGNLVAYTYPPPGCGAPAELGVVDLRTGRETTRVVVPEQSEASLTQGVLWHVQWAGEIASAVPDSTVTSTNGRDFTTNVEVPSHDGRFTILYAATTPVPIPSLTAIDTTSGASADLGPGGIPAWSPDDSAIAFVQLGGPAGPDAIDYLRDHLVIASVGTWQTRVLADILVPDGPPTDLLPRLAWTSDGSAVYWTDITGGHVIDVVTGRSMGLPALPPGCVVEWQPVGG